MNLSSSFLVHFNTLLMLYTVKVSLRKNVITLVNLLVSTFVVGVGRNKEFRGVRAARRPKVAQAC